MRIVFFTLLILVITLTHAYAAQDEGRVVMIVTGNLSIRDITKANLPSISYIMQNGSAGLMNVRTGRPGNEVEWTNRYGLEAECVSLGAGAMAVGGAEVRRAADTSGTINGSSSKHLYRCRTGLIPEQVEVIHTEIAKITKANASASYHASPGALGEILRNRGIKTAVIGNSDLPGEVHREVVAVAMDAHGTVDYGSVSSPTLTLTDQQAPYGVRTNIDTLSAEFKRVIDLARFVVVDFGDTFRADSYSEYARNEQVPILKQQAVRRFDKFLGQVLSEMDLARDLLIVLSPNASGFTDLDGERLAPVVAVGPGFAGGLLSSPSTRTDGIVTISDVAPTIINFFDLDTPLHMVGRAMFTVNTPHTTAILLEMNENAAKQAQRQSIMRGSSVVQSMLVVALTLVIVLGIKSPFRSFVEWIVLVPALLPVVMLYLPLIYNGGFIGSVVWLIALTLAVLVFCSAIFRTPQRAFVWICGVIVLSLMIDLMRGSPLIAASIAGYSVVEGARYYGIGNELMGTMIGAAITGIGMMLGSEKMPRVIRPWTALLVLGFVFIFIGAPVLGANLGGALAAGPAIVVTLLVRRGWRPSLKGIAIVLAITAILVGGIFLIDALRAGGNQSHVGRVVETTTDSGPLGLLLVFQRKMALNFMLVSNSLWSRLLGLSLVGAIIFYWFGKRRTSSELLNQEHSAAVAGCSVAIAAAFAFNDSGVVAAATCAVFLWMLLALKVLSNSKPNTKPEAS